MKELIFSLMTFVYMPALAFAGGTGGGTPPALQDTLELLMFAERGSGALFDNRLGDVSLLTNRELQPQLSLSKSKLLGADITMREVDFDLLRDRTAPLETIGALGENRSFKISSGDQLDSLILIDRRAAARASVAK